MLTSSTDMNIPVTRTSSETIHGVADPRDGAGAGAGGGGAGGATGAGASTCGRAGATAVVVAVSCAVDVVVITGSLPPFPDRIPRLPIS
jgi:hypothetical protein